MPENSLDFLPLKGDWFFMSLPRGFCSRFFVVAACLFLLTLPGSVSAQVSVPAAVPQIVEHVDEGRLVTLSGNTRPEARAEYDQGHVAPDLKMGDLFLVLKRSAAMQAAADKFVASQYDSNSPNFHHWLTPEQIGEMFGPAQSDIDSITNWLQNRGFTIDNISKDRLTVRFSGRASQIESTFHTEIHNLKVKGEDHIANMSDPQIPAALAPVVVGVKALHNFFPHPQNHLGSQVRRNSKSGGWERISGSQLELSDGRKISSQERPLFGVNLGSNHYPVEDVTPYDFAAIYNVTPLWNASTPIDGSGQTIAIAGRSNINLADVASFRSSFGLPVKVPTVKLATATDPGLNGDQTENTLDVEWAGAIAKQASIILVTSAAATSSTDALALSEQYIVDNAGTLNVSIMNVSYGECELGLGTTGNASYNTLWQTAAMEKLSVFVSAGDNGAATCDAGNDYVNDGNQPTGAQLGLSVNGFASTQYDTAVGGTDFNWISTATTTSSYWDTTNSTNLANAKGYIPEIPWNNTCTNSVADALLGFSSSTTFESVCNTALASYGKTNDVSFLDNTVGGGGGVSNCTVNDSKNTTSCKGGNVKPSWQIGVAGIPSDGLRDVPDVSLFAANGFLNSAYLICVTAAGTGCTYPAGTEPIMQEIGGTSVASPIMASIMALVNENTGSAQGNLSPELYKLASRQTYANCKSESVLATSTSCVFNDIDKGTISLPCIYDQIDTPHFLSPDCTDSSPKTDVLGVLNGYDAAAGYDLATGLGSVNVANLVTAAYAPIVSLSPTSLTFASTVIGVSATTQTVTLSNTGDGPLTVSASGVTISGSGASSFAETDTCAGKSVAVNSSCTITVKFTPTASGTLNASLSIADNANGSPQTVSLTGTGSVPVPAATLTPTSLTFGATTEGTAAATQAITVTNTGTGALIVSANGVSITGTNMTSFTETDTCNGVTVAVSGTCIITVTFKPTTFGSLSASVSIADNASGSPQTVGLTGTGLEIGSYTLAASTPAAAAPGSSGKSTITATPSGGYTGVITLKCLVAPITGGVDVPTCSAGSGSPITVTAAGAVPGTVTVSTTAASTLARKGSGATAQLKSKGWLGAGGVALACVLLFGIPARRRAWKSLLGVLVFMAALGVLSGCGGGGGGTVTQQDPGTTAGAYTVTVTGTDAAGVSAPPATFIFTVN